MSKNSTFSKAVLAGMAAPVSLFSGTAAYSQPISANVTAQSFATVGRALSGAMLAQDEAIRARSDVKKPGKRVA